MASVEHREILLLLGYVGNTEILTHCVWQEVGVIRLLRSLDIQHVRIDLRFGRTFCSFVARVLCPEHLRLI